MAGSLMNQKIHDNWFRWCLLSVSYSWFFCFLTSFGTLVLGSESNPQILNPQGPFCPFETILGSGDAIVKWLICTISSDSFLYGLNFNLVYVYTCVCIWGWMVPVYGGQSSAFDVIPQDATHLVCLIFIYLLLFLIGSLIGLAFTFSARLAG